MVCGREGARMHSESHGRRMLLPAWAAAPISTSVGVLAIPSAATARGASVPGEVGPAGWRAGPRPREKPRRSERS